MILHDMSQLAVSRPRASWGAARPGVVRVTAAVRSHAMLRKMTFIATDSTDRGSRRAEAHHEVIRNLYSITTRRAGTIKKERKKRGRELTRRMILREGSECP